MRTKKMYKVSVRKRENPLVLSRTVIYSQTFESFQKALTNFKETIAEHELNFNAHESDKDEDRVCLRIYDSTKKILILLEQV
jgi:hypothetical protein